MKFLRIWSVDTALEKYQVIFCLHEKGYILMSERKIQSVPTLTTRQKQFLKGLAHPLNPLVQIGKEELSPGIIETIKTELSHHELIKVKIGSNCGLEKQSTSLNISEQTASALVQVIGKTIILYKPNPKRAKEKRIRLPKAT